MTGMTLDRFDVTELDKAFAAQGLAVLRALGLADDDPRVDPDGGAMAPGRPLGGGALRAGAAGHGQYRDAVDLNGAPGATSRMRRLGPCRPGFPGAQTSVAHDVVDRQTRLLRDGGNVRARRIDFLAPALADLVVDLELQAFEFAKVVI